MNYLLRLRQRMEKRGFPPDDPYYLLVCRAYDSMHRLSVETHYLSCDGVGRLRSEDRSSTLAAFGDALDARDP